MSREYTDQERAQARERMRRLREDPEYVRKERDIAYERIRQLRKDPDYAQCERDAARERMRRLRRSSSYNARELQHHIVSTSDMTTAIGNRPRKCVYDSWYTLRRRALQAGEPEETILTLDQWISIVEYYGGVCLCCGEARELTFDHVLPISLGGTFTADNIQPLCLRCNIAKRNRYIDYRPDAGAFASRSLSVR